MPKNIITKRFDARTFVPTNSGNDYPTAGEVIAWMRRVKDDEARLAAVLVDMRRPRGVNSRHYGVSAFKSGREPMLNADKRAIERSLSKHFDEHGSTHAKLKMIKAVVVKPESNQAAKIAGSWASHTWQVWSLKYSPGLVLRDHKGNESSVFPGWGKMKQTLEQLGFKIIK